jgi:hypothetical protein
MPFIMVVVPQLLRRVSPHVLSFLPHPLAARLRSHSSDQVFVEEPGSCKVVESSIAMDVSDTD